MRTESGRHTASRLSLQGGHRRASLATAAGTPAIVTGFGAPVNVHSTLGACSWLGSVDTTVAQDVSDRWSLSIGYRVAHARGMPDARSVDHSGVVVVLVKNHPVEKKSEKAYRISTSRP